MKAELTGIYPALKKRTVRLKAALAAAASNVVIHSIKVPTGQIFHVKIVAVARGGTERAVYEITGAISNVGGTVALVGTPDVLAFENDTAWSLTIAADNTNKALNVVATGDSANAVRMDGSIELIVA